MTENYRIRVDLLQTFVTAVFEAIGLPVEQAVTAADVLVWANRRGVDIHGVRNLKSHHVDKITAGKINIHPEFRIEHETPISARMDGDNGLGMAAACWAMRLAVHKAARSGAGFVTLYNSSDCGAAGYYSTMAVRENLIGMSMTSFLFTQGSEFGSQLNDSACPTFTANPILVAFPTGQETPSLDGIWKQDGNKGHGWATMVDELRAILYADRFSLPFNGTNPVSPYRKKQDTHFFAALQVDLFPSLAEFKKSMEAVIPSIHTAEPEPGQSRVYVVGEIEHETEKERLRTGIPLPPDVAADLWTLSKLYQVPIVLEKRR